MRLSNDMTIGRHATEAQCTVPTIRYYEEIGLLPEATRRISGHRVYSDGDLRRLTFLRRCRDFGFPIERIRDLVALLGSPRARMHGDARSCRATPCRSAAQAHGVARALERSLKSFVSDCNTQCAGGPVGTCVILEDLAKPKPPCCELRRAKDQLARPCDDERRPARQMTAPVTSQRSGRSPSTPHSQASDATM